VTGRHPKTLNDSGRSPDERSRQRQRTAVIRGPTVIVPIDNLWWPVVITV